MYMRGGEGNQRTKRKSEDIRGEGGEEKRGESEDKERGRVYEGRGGEGRGEGEGNQSTETEQGYKRGGELKEERDKERGRV